MTWPPPGLWLELASEPILGWTPHRLGEGAVPTTIRFIGTGEERGGGGGGGEREVKLGMKRK